MKHETINQIKSLEILKFTDHAEFYFILKYGRELHRQNVGGRHLSIFWLNFFAFLFFFFFFLYLTTRTHVFKFLLFNYSVVVVSSCR